MSEEPRLRVLVVDDEEGIRKTIRRVLASHEVALCPDGASALALLETQPFDVVLCDLNMPGGLSGLEVHRSIASRWPALLPRVVLVSGGGHRDDPPPGAPDVRWLDKPFTPDELRRTVLEVGVSHG